MANESRTSAVAAGKPRVTAFDGFRGVAIICVVFAHAAGYGWSFQTVPGGLFNFYYSIAMRNLALFSLPLFLFVSGYWLASIDVTTRAEYDVFLRKRVSRIVIPYLFWSVVFVSWQMFRSGSHSPLVFFMKIALGQADGPYYFILLMIQFYILAPVFVQWTRSGRGMLLLIVAHGVCVAGLYALRAGHYPDLSYATVKLPFLSWLSLFPLGMYVRQRPALADCLGLPALIGAALALFLGQMAESVLLLGQGWFEFAISDVRFFSLFYGVAMIFCFMKFRDRAWPAPFVMLGEYSFGIFFIHGIFLRGAARGLAMIPGLMDVQPLFQGLLTVLTVGCSVAAIALVRRVLGRESSSRWLGF